MNQYLKRALISLLLIITVSLTTLFVTQNVLTKAIDASSYERLLLNEENHYTTQVTQNYPDATLSLFIRNQRLTLSLNDTVFYRNTDGDGIFLIALALPESTTDFKLSLTFYSDDPHFNKTLEPIYLGSMETLLKLRVIQSLPELFLCIFVFFLALLMLFLSTRRHFERPEKMSLRYAGIYAILWTIYFLGVSPIVVTSANPYLLTLINYGVFSSLPLPLTLVAYYQVRSTQNYLRFFIRMYALSYLLATVLLFYNFKSIYTSYYYFLYFQYALFIIVFIVLLIESLRKNKKAQVSFIALLFLLVGVGVNDYFYVTQETDSILVSYVISYLAAFYLVYIIYVYHVRERAYEDKRDFFRLKNKLLSITYNALQSKMTPIHKLRHEVLNHKLSLSLIQQDKDSERYLNYLAKVRKDHKALQVIDTFYLDDLCHSALANVKHENINLEFRIDKTYAINLERLQILHYLTLLLETYATTYTNQTLKVFIKCSGKSITLTITSLDKMKTIHMKTLKQFNELFSYKIQISTSDVMVLMRIGLT